MVNLCQELHVPCNHAEPDPSTASAIVNTVKQMIESACETIAASQSDAHLQATIATASLTALSDGHQKSASGSPTVGTARKDQEGNPPAGGGTDALNGNSTEHRVEDVSARQPVAATYFLATPEGTVLPPRLTPAIVGVTPGDSDSPQLNDRESGSTSDEAQRTEDEQAELVHGESLAPHTAPSSDVPKQIGKWKFIKGKIRYLNGD